MIGHTVLAGTTKLLEEIEILAIEACAMSPSSPLASARQSSARQSRIAGPLSSIRQSRIAGPRTRGFAAARRALAALVAVGERPAVERLRFAVERWRPAVERLAVERPFCSHMNSLYMNHRLALIYTLKRAFT